MPTNTKIVPISIERKRLERFNRLAKWLDLTRSGLLPRLVGNEWERYTLQRKGEVLLPERFEPEVEVEQARVAGAISTNLYDAVDALGESGELAHDFADIFAWDADFSRSVRPGDEFHILYERRYLKSEKGERRYVGAGRILAARYAPVLGEEHSAVYYEHGSGRGGYYRADGTLAAGRRAQAAKGPRSKG